MLNGRVRNGNGWGHPGMLTGKVHVACRLRFAPVGYPAGAKRKRQAGIAKGSGRVVSLKGPLGEVRGGW
jgi:hypothetical protein